MAADSDDDRRRPAKPIAWLALFATIPAASAIAEVSLDGSIGSAGAGPVATVVGPSGGVDHLITEADGQRAGANLFHSFDRFDLTASERAIYQGDPSIENLVTRVTGGPSSIDGTIRSEIPGANLFFLNPAGVVFGENAEVDLTGSFYVSTADRLLFEGGDAFETASGAGASLSVETVAGFGFLEAPAAIRIEGSQIELAFDHDIALIGGDLEIRGDRSDGQAGLLSARSGRVDLASLASSGEVYLPTGADVNEGLLRVENVSARGDVAITGNTTVNTSGIDRDPRAGAFFAPGDGSGPVHVYANDLTMVDSDIRTLTVTREDAGDVTIELSGDFNVRSVAGGEQSGIVAGTGLFIEREPGDVVTSEFTPFHPNTFVRAQFCGAEVCSIRYTANGNAGDVDVEARNVRFEGGGRITARSDTEGDAGTVRLRVEDSIFFSGIEENGERSGLSSTADSVGNPGAVEIIAPDASLVMGDGAAIVIQNSGESIATSTPGRIELEVASLEMSGDARIDSSTRGAGPGGALEIRARDSIELRGRSSPEDFTGITTLSQPGSTGTAGTIRIETQRLTLEDGAEIAARPAGEDAFGDAGSLELVVSDRISLRDASISAESDRAAGGNITGSFGNALDLEDAKITTTVTRGAESGGNILLTSNPGSSVVLENSQIIAEAAMGAGGRIELETGLLIQDPASRISATSTEGGVDGTVIVRAPDGQLVELAQELTPPPIDASALLDEPCAARRPGGANSLVVAELEGLPLGAEAVMPAFLPKSVYARLADTVDVRNEAGQAKVESGVAGPSERAGAAGAGSESPVVLALSCID